MQTVVDPVEQMDVAVTVNGRTYERRVPVRRLLADFIRDDLQLTGTHLGCEHGVCGACTVVMDGEAVRSCLVFAFQADGGSITTVEGLSTRGTLSDLQEAFSSSHALQCGFCTPGFLMTLHAENPATWQGDDRIRELLSGNLCRCTGYSTIVDAVRKAWSTPDGAASESEDGSR
jgi:aerobic-type carbon monoxide dehydrogenase small subunit (CoxS/CutS family)